MRRHIELACAAVLAVTTTIGAHATTTNITQNDLWYGFDIDDQTALSGGTEWIDILDNIGEPLSFSFSLAAPTFLRVVDAGYAGDRFNVSIFNGSTTSTLQTSVAVDSYPTGVLNDYDAAWADPNYSHLTFLLGPGTYTVTGDLFSSASFPENVTTGALMLAAPVPEPSQWLLLLAGLGVLGAYAPRRSHFGH